MTEHQRVALAHQCRLAIETVHPRFIRFIGGRYSVVLTINSGYE